MRSMDFFENFPAAWFGGYLYIFDRMGVVVDDGSVTSLAIFV